MVMPCHHLLQQVAQGQGSKQPASAQQRPQEPVGQGQYNQAAIKQRLLERLADDVSLGVQPSFFGSKAILCALNTGHPGGRGGIPMTPTIRGDQCLGDF